MTRAMPLGPALALALAAAGCWDSVVGGHDGGPADDAGPACASISVSAPPSIGEGIELPSNTHISWQGSPDTTLTFSWRTVAQSGYAPKVWLAPAYLCSVVDGEVHLPAGPGNLFAGFGEAYAAEGGGETKAWVVEATGLAPDTDYFYRVGTWNFFDSGTGEVLGPRLGPVHRVHTGLPHGSSAPFTFAVAGDTQGALVDLADHIEEIAQTPAAFWLLTGDMVSSSTQTNWNLWFAAAAPLLESAVAMPVPGNHEASYGTFYGQFALPIEPDLAPELAEHAWSFDYGNAHVVGLDSNADADMEAIAAWLDADLAAAEADPDIDWKIAFFHHPAYSASSHGCTARVLEHWSPVLEAHGVDLVFSGHDHDYERTYPIAGGYLAVPGSGVRYIVAGGFFTSLYNAGADWWTAYSNRIDNYVVVDVDGDTLHLTAIDPNEQVVFDEVYLTK
jgi:acid phosphatase type 7